MVETIENIVQIPTLDSVSEYEQSLGKDRKYELISLVAYLIGVDKRVFEMETEPPKIEIFNELEKNKHAKIIRNLCMFRTAIEKNYKKVTAAILSEGRSIFAMHEFLPTKCLTELDAENIRFTDKENRNTNKMLFALNRELKSRINNCQDLNNVVKWEYLVDLILMPNGDTVAGLEVEAEKYYNNIKFYPYSKKKK